MLVLQVLLLPLLEAVALVTTHFGLVWKFGFLLNPQVVQVLPTAPSVVLLPLDEFFGTDRPLPPATARLTTLDLSLQFCKTLSLLGLPTLLPILYQAFLDGLGAVQALRNNLLGFCIYFRVALRDYLRCVLLLQLHALLILLLPQTIQPLMRWLLLRWWPFLRAVRSYGAIIRLVPLFPAREVG